MGLQTHKWTTTFSPALVSRVSSPEIATPYILQSQANDVYSCHAIRLEETPHPWATPNPWAHTKLHLESGTRVPITSALIPLVGGGNGPDGQELTNKRVETYMLRHHVEPKRLF